MSIAVYKNKTYYKGELVNGRIHIDMFTENLPEINNNSHGITITEELLEGLNVPNLGYNKTENGFQLFDKSKETYDEETLPIYVEVFDSPKYTKKYTTIKTPTKEAIEAAREILISVNAELLKMEQMAKAKKLSQKIEDGNGIAYIWNSSYFTVKEILDYIPGAKILLNPYYSIYIVGTTAKADELELKVPKHIIPSVIGNGGANIKAVAKEIGAKYIKVLPL